jgi:hypothetical protein
VLGWKGERRVVRDAAGPYAGGPAPGRQAAGVYRKKRKRIFIKEKKTIK